MLSMMGFRVTAGCDWAGLAYFVMRLLPFPFPLLAAPVEVILLVCINSPMYLEIGLLVDGSLNDAASYHGSRQHGI